MKVFANTADGTIKYLTLTLVVFEFFQGGGFAGWAVKVFNLNIGCI